MPDFQISQDDPPITYTLRDVVGSDNGSKILEGWITEADDTRTLVSFMIFSLDDQLKPDCVEVRGIWTHEDFRDRGFIKQLSKRVYEAAIKLGATRAVGLNLFDTKPLEAAGAVKTGPNSVEYQLVPPGALYTRMLNETV